MPLHRIRLPAPWQATWQTNSDDSLSLRMQRRFQRPSGLDSQTEFAIEVDLRQLPALATLECFINKVSCGAVTLSGQRYAAGVPLELLQASNELSLRLDWVADTKLASLSEPERSLPAVELVIRDQPN